MKTKTVLLLSLTVGLGSARLLAQTNVTQTNAVGYLNATIMPGFNIIACPLQVSPTNTIGDLFNNAAGDYDGLKIYKWNGATFDTDTADSQNSTNVNGWESNGVVTLNPGEAVWFSSDRLTNLIVTFEGEIPQGWVTNAIAGPGKFSMLSSVVPESGDLATQLGMTNFQDGDQIFVFDPASQSYRVYNYSGPTGDSGFGGGFTAHTGNPQIPVCQGFLYHTGAKSTPTNWVRYFQLN